MNIINGKEIAQKIRDGIKEEIQSKQIEPCLAVVLIGDDPASQIYVRNKEKACEEVGIISKVIRLPGNIDLQSVKETIKEVNNSKNIHGILVQLPIPAHLPTAEVINLISPAKDVDGLHPENLGRLLKGENPLFVSCTPQGIMHLILSTGIDLKGKNAVVIGRSNIVGKPVAILLLDRHATVTICHSRTPDLAAEVKRADVLVAAVGKAQLITGEMIKPGAVVIDVGMNRTDKGLVGDVDFESAKEVASFITPVPGGVGPMTIAMLLKNTLIAAQRT